MSSLCALCGERAATSTCRRCGRRVCSSCSTHHGLCARCRSELPRLGWR
ncbi:MAG: hypothetical protein QXU97_04530 [Fervidicoccaceae archaeon]